ncbi:MAG TPA: cold shock domain-containing protein [Mucilaginibacter sp.]|nr:cold shock domain-containing protein [Mucilaginibacter sp.]
MGRSSETFNKKEKEKKRLKKQQEKKEKAEHRKANSSKGKGLEDMMAYIDENGDIVSTPPAAGKRKPIDAAGIEITVPKRTADATNGRKTGVISFFNTSKGYGFIRDSETGENVFFHVNGLTYQAKENDRVSFATERGPKGINATEVTKN